MEFRKKILEKCGEAQWTVESEGNPFKHHFLLNVRNPHEGKLVSKTTTAADGKEEDFMDLSGL